MSDIKLAYGTASQAITMTLASLANGSAREATAVDNTTNKFLDAIVYLKIALQAGTPSSEKVLKVYFYCSEDGTNYSHPATGADAAITPSSNLFGPFLIYTPTGGVAYNAVISAAQFFGGILPPKWGIAVQNATGVALSATAGDHTKEYRGVYQTVS